MRSAHISPDGKFALTTATDGAGILWNIPDMTRALLLRGSASLIAGRIHPNNVHAIILGQDNRIGYWDTVTGEQLRNIEAIKRGQVTCMDLSPDGMYIAIGTEEGSVRVIRYNEARTVRLGKVAMTD